MLNGFVTLKSGDKAVRVTLQHKSKLHETSRELRKNELIKRFKQIQKLIGHDLIEIDFDSLSLSAQTIEANLLFKKFDECEKDLENQNIRIDILIDREIIQ